MTPQQLIKYIQSWFLQTEKNALNLQRELIQLQNTPDKNIKTLIYELKKEIEDFLEIKIDNEEQLMFLIKSPPGAVASVVDFFYNMIVDPSAKSQKQQYKEKMRDFSKSISHQNIKLLGQVLGYSSEAIEVIFSRIYNNVKPLFVKKTDLSIVEDFIRDCISAGLKYKPEVLRTDNIPKFLLSNLNSYVAQLFKDPEKFVQFKKVLLQELTPFYGKDEENLNKFKQEISQWNFNVGDKEVKSQLTINPRDKIIKFLPVFQFRIEQKEKIFDMVPYVVSSIKDSNAMSGYDKYFNQLLAPGKELSLILDRIVKIIAEIIKVSEQRQQSQQKPVVEPQKAQPIIEKPIKSENKTSDVSEVG